MFETILRVLNSYPFWAKICAVGGVTFSVLVLVFAPRTDASAQPKSPNAQTVSPTAPGQTIFLRIIGVKLFPDDPNAEVQVLAIVNQTTYEHPSVGGVKWMKVGPDMSPKLIELPKALLYQIRFEMHIRGGSDLTSTKEKNLADKPFMRSGSQLIDNITKLPFSEEYKLYNIKDGIRDASVRASVSYSITEGR